MLSVRCFLTVQEPVFKARRISVTSPPAVPAIISDFGSLNIIVFILNGFVPIKREDCKLYISRLFQHVQFVKCGRTVQELNS